MTDLDVVSLLVDQLREVHTTLAKQSEVLQRIEVQTTRTNGRVTALERSRDQQEKALEALSDVDDETVGRVIFLEKARERGQGMVSAFRWLPQIAAGAAAAGVTVLLTAVFGGIH